MHLYLYFLCLHLCLLQALLVKRALQYLGVSVAQAPSTYWNLPKHLNQSREEAAALYAEEDAFWLHNTSKVTSS